MEIFHDPRLDAVTISLSTRTEHAITHNVDDDIALSLDAFGRLVGVEVLNASKRLDLDYLLPQATTLGGEGSVAEEPETASPPGPEDSSGGGL